MVTEKIEAEVAWVAHQFACAAQAVAAEWSAPSVVHRPKIYRDGDQWCALLGKDMMEGIYGLGKSPAEAARAFDLAWHEKLDG